MAEGGSDPVYANVVVNRQNVMSEVYGDVEEPSDVVVYDDVLEGTADDEVEKPYNRMTSVQRRQKPDGKTTVKFASVKPQSVRQQGVMTEDQKNVIRQCWHTIVENVQVQDVIDHLIAAGVFDVEMSQEIKAQRVPRDCIIRLLERLMTRGSEAYSHFRNIMKLKYDYIYTDMKVAEARVTEVDPHPFNYHEPPIDGETLRNNISNFKQYVPLNKSKERARVERDLQQLEEGDIFGYFRPEAPQTIGRKQGKLIKKWATEAVNLDQGEEVFIMPEDESQNEVTIITRFGLTKIPRSHIKFNGDLSIERYCFQQNIPLKPHMAKVFVEQTVKKSKRNGVFFVYKPEGRCHFKCEYHLCVGFSKDPSVSVNNYHIRNRYGYFLTPFDTDDEGTYTVYRREPMMKFPNITDLIDYYTYTSDKVLEGTLQWPMLDAESPLKPEKDFIEPLKSLKKNEYIATSTTLGRGYFATVLKGTIRLPGSGTVTIAIKSPNRLNQTREKRDELYREGKILAAAKHENILKLIGVCFTDDTSHLITELATKGCLWTVVRKKGLRSSRYNINHMADFKAYAQRIASGMKHLEDKFILHRDLALRNILLFDNGLVKIADFGQARRLYGPDYNYYITKNDVISTRWTAPEVLATLRHYLKSEVWSFGIVLHELFSYGKRPYEKLESQNVWGYIIENGHPDKPEGCPDDMYKVMSSCWIKDIKKRPTFAALFESLLMDSYQSLHPEMLKTVMNEEEYAQRIHTALTLEQYGEKYVNRDPRPSTYGPSDYTDVYRY